MTVITKPITEKKIDNLEQPLVIAECLPHQDVEGGRGDSLPPPDRLMILHARRASSITTACLLLMALLVMCCGVLGGFYFYKQYAHAQVHRLRGWCRVPYGHIQEQQIQSEQLQLQQESQELPMDLYKISEADSIERFMAEQIDIDEDEDSEKITVPRFDGSRSSRFIHDFNANKTGILDLEGKRCFVMPLNHTQVLPPRDLMDLMRKMWQGYYMVDTATIRQTMRVVGLQDPNTVGLYIQRECAGYPIFKLEKIVSGVYKRSIPADGVLFRSFAGSYQEIDITNLADFVNEQRT